MESFETAACFVSDDLLDFNVGDEHDGPDKNPTSRGCSLAEFGEEDLEWLSNKDAFPSIDDILIDPTHHSPVSVLENSSSSSAAVSKGSIIIYCSGSLRVPVKARSRRRRRCRPDLRVLDSWWVRGKAKCPREPSSSRAGMGRKCQHCGAEKTPQWRAGPLGPKTLCNACGVRFKSGRLVPEYRPASSPTFSGELHSNSHKKILEMRRQKLSGMGPVNKD